MRGNHNAGSFTSDKKFPAIRAILKTGFEPIAAQYRGFEEEQ
jgi:hypothetical protein